MPPGKAKCEVCGLEFSGEFPKPGNSTSQVDPYLAFEIKEHHNKTREESGKEHGHMWFNVTLEDGTTGILAAHSWGVEFEYSHRERN